MNYASKNITFNAYNPTAYNDFSCSFFRSLELQVSKVAKASVNVNKNGNIHRNFLLVQLHCKCCLPEVSLYICYLFSIWIPQRKNFSNELNVSHLKLVFFLNNERIENEKKISYAVGIHYEITNSPGQIDLKVHFKSDFSHFLNFVIFQSDVN